MSDNLHNPLKNFARNFKTYTTRLPLRISQRALLEMKNNFSKQGYESESGGFVKWAPRKTPPNSKKARLLNRALLIKTGRLRRSLKAAPLPGVPRVITNVEYAEAMHSGFKGTQNVKPHKRTSTIKRKVRGAYSGLSASGKLNTRSKTIKLQGARHNVKAFSRKVDIKARPFLTVGPSFLNKEEVKLLDELENLFLQA